jgi:hypothetical protein
VEITRTATCKGCGAARDVDGTPCAVCGQTSKTVYATLRAEIKATGTVSGVAMGMRDVTVQWISATGRAVKLLGSVAPFAIKSALRQHPGADEVSDAAGWGLDAAGERIRKRSVQPRYIEVGRIDPDANPTDPPA